MDFLIELWIILRKFLRNIADGISKKNNRRNSQKINQRNFISKFNKKVKAEGNVE